MPFVAWSGLAVIVGAIVYWLLITTEGTYLGSRAVIRLYDWSALKYNDIKELHYVDEARCLGIPLSQALEAAARPVVLDLATGTGRVPLALLPNLDAGQIVGLDGSLDMLRIAQADTADWGRVTFVLGDARQPPFAAAGFDGVTCLEALEFMPRPRQVLDEIWRVLKPGGLLLISNRVGHDAWFFPGRMCGRGRLERELVKMGFSRVTMQRWQVHYDLIWAYKPTD